MSDLPPSLIHPAELPEEDQEDEQPEQINEEDIDEIIEDDDDYPMDGDEFDPDGDQDEDGVPGGVTMEEVDGEEEEEDMGPVVDNSASQATLHREGSSVFEVALHPLHPNPPLAVSGGEDDLAFIFNTQTGKEVVKLSGHEDSVVAVSFSSDGELVATGGMDGRVRIWRRVGKTDWNTWEFLTSLQGPDEVTCMAWHPKGPVLAAGATDSTVWMWQLPSGNNMQVFAGHTDAITAIAFTPDGKRLLTASADSSLILWDPRSSSPVQNFKPTDDRFYLEDGITSIASHPNSQLAAVGGGAGGLRVVNLSTGRVVSALQGHAEGDSVEAVVFLEIAGNGVVVSAGTDGKACVWDVTTSRLRATLKHEQAITSLRLHPAPLAHLITTGSVDATLKTWDVRNGAELAHHTGNRGIINGFDVGRGKEGRAVVISAGDDGASLIWEI